MIIFRISNVSNPGYADLPAHRIRLHLCWLFLHSFLFLFRKINCLKQRILIIEKFSTLFVAEIWKIIEIKLNVLFCRCGGRANSCMKYTLADISFPAVLLSNRRNIKQYKYSLVNIYNNYAKTTLRLILAALTGPWNWFLKQSFSSSSKHERIT